MYISMGSYLIWVVSFKIYVSPLGTMLFPMSETFKKSQLSEFFDVSSGCIWLQLNEKKTEPTEINRAYI